MVLVVVLAAAMSYILLFGWNFEFTKRQFTFIMIFLILFGVFLLAWFRETGDELLIGLAMFGMLLYLIIKWLLERRRQKWVKKRGR